jgi:DNA-binding MarR family transcriptional regulator
MRLVASGLVLAEVSKRDRRLNVLKLSRKGKSVLAAIVPIAHGLQNQLVASLASPERDALIRTVNKLHRAISDMRLARIEADAGDGGRPPRQIG